MKTYREALKEASRVGAAHAQGEALIAQTAAIVASKACVQPAALYRGAVRAGITDGLTLARKTPGELLDLALDGAIP